MNQNLTLMDLYRKDNKTREAIEDLKGLYSFFSMVAVFVLITNLIVVISSGLLFKKGYEPRCTYLLLGNISLSDLINSVVVLIGWFKTENSVLYCNLHLGFYVMSAIASCLSVGLIALDRYIYIIHGMRYNQIVTHGRVRYMLWGIWIIAFVAGIFPVYFYGREAPACWVTLVAPPKIIFLITLVGIVPLICIIVFYTIILYKAIQNNKRVERFMTARAEKGDSNDEGLRVYTGKKHIGCKSFVESNGSKNSLHSRSRLIIDSCYTSNKWKAIKVVLFTAATFFITWAPYFITSSIYAFCDQKTNPKECNEYLVNVMSPLGMLTFSGTLTNPLIYAWWHNRFRESIIKMFTNRKRLYQLRKNLEYDTTKKEKCIVEITHM